jgi:protein phosphatase 1 regulatory subunit 21
LKEKDQAIRKFEQEIDSLAFRNNQLSTRVTVLQQELEEVLVQGKKHKVNRSESGGS